MFSPRHIRLLLVPAILILIATLPLVAQTIDRPPRVPDGISGADTSAFVPLLEYVEDTDNTGFGHTELSNTPGTKIDSLVHAGTTGLNYCNDLVIHSGSFRVTLDLGDDYNYGTTVFTVNVDLKIEGIDTDAGDTILITLNPVPLTINRDAPEQTYYVEFSGADLTNHDDVDIYRVYVNSYSVSGGVDTAVRVTVWYDDEFSVDPIRPSPDEDKPIVYLQAVSGFVGGAHDENPLQLIWNIAGSCADRFPSYQLQILRLYNLDTGYTDEPYELVAVVNWKEALTVEVAGTNSSYQTAKLTIPQGTGWYLWRVRPIGSLYEGGSADARNWGVWSKSFPDDTMLTAFNVYGYSGSLGDTSAFYYESFEDTLVWVYSRAFTEGAEGVGSRVAEGMTFLSPSGRPTQSQARVAEDETYLTANSVVDFQGRATLSTMATPTGNSSEGFRFRRDLFNINATDPYTAEHFDDDANWDDPDAVAETNGSASKYYNGTTEESGSQVPDAEGYPFVRTLLTTDGSGRPMEIGGVGETHRIGGGAGGKERTARIYYASASDRELVRLFGDEAPLDTNVSKLLIIGPNKVTTVQWVAEGHVIATALQRSIGDTLLVALADTNEPVLEDEIVDTLRGNRTRGQLGVSAQKRYAFTEPTDVEIHYHLNPDSITTEGLCIDTCTTCDYRVCLYVHNIDLKDSTQVFEHKLGAEPCGGAGDIDTTITLTLGPGTFIIERRLEIGTVDPATIDSLHPYGGTYADQFREVVAGLYRDSILADESIAAIIEKLDEGNLESLYEDILGLSLDSITTYGSVTISTACCDITFPILDPDCGFNPCKNGTPDFEEYLYDTWGDTYGDSLNAYFKFDGTIDLYPWANRPDSVGAFNVLITNMLDDTTALGAPLYECKTLWNIWVGLVDAFERLKQDPENPSAFNPDFNMLDVFLQAAGVYWIDTAQTPYSADTGYLSWAHRYVKSDVLSDSLCKVRTGYDIGWHGDVDSTGKWMELYNCWVGGNRNNIHSGLKRIGLKCDLDDTLNGDPTGEPDWDTMSVAHREDSCMTFSARRVEDDCMSVCERRRTEFAWAIMKAYEEAEEPINFSEAMCAADAIVDSCSGDCHLTVYTDTSGIDSIGSAAEWDAIGRIRTWKVEVAIPLTDSLDEKYCANDTMTLTEERTMPSEELIVAHLNRRLAEFWRVNGGTYWTGFMDALREVAPDSIVARITDSTVIVPPFAFGAVPPRFELRDGCELWFVADTIFWHDIYPDLSHPMVANLNSFLDGFWGMDIDSSVAGNAADCLINGVGERIRDYDFRTSTDVLFTSYLEQPVSLVNGIIDYHDIDYYLDFISEEENALFFDSSSTGSLFGQFRIQGTGGNTDDLSLTTARRCVGSLDFLDVIHTLSATGACGSEYIVRVVESGIGFDSTGYGPANTHLLFRPEPSYTDLETALSISYTALIGIFDTDDEGYLIYHSRYWDHPLFEPDTCRVFGLRFFGDPTHKLTDSVCGLKACPDVCWRWVPPTIDTGTLSGPPPCEETAIRRIRGAINRSINECIDRDLFDLRRQYENKCGNPDSLDEVITVEYPVDYIHFSLSYYDRAGHLVRTIPPKGVNVLGPTATRMDATSHTFATEYEYNAFGHLIRTKSPDGGQSRYWYDHVGRLRFSQDARFLARNEYAYTKFDDRGRVIEFGVSDDSIAGYAFAADTNIQDPDFPPSGIERTYFAYDTSSGVNYLNGSPQRFLRNQVSRTWTDDTVITHFSYDVHGNVEWVGQEIPGFPRVNYTKYDYDLISGNVNEVIYNEDRVDEFRHRYTYDADNALIQVETSRDGVVWDTDARYEYYKHGGLRRVELGEDKLQGLDYTYTIDGQLKAINHPSLGFSADPGKDGGSAHGNQPFARDSFSIVLHYHPKDFPPAGAANGFYSGGTDDLAPVPQYDGNIAGMETHVGKTTPGNKYEERTGESYRYDQLGRLDSSRFHTWDTGTDDWNDFTDEYLTTYEYDPNGNIKLLERHGYDQSGDTWMDSIVYHYQGGDSNKLDYVHDAVPGVPYGDDISNTQSSNNYEYDEIGNLIQDNDEGGMTMTWDASGRVKEIDRAIPSPVATQTIDYTYDAGGNRVKKVARVATGLDPPEENETYYVHDAGGVVMAIYEKRCYDYAVAPPGAPGPDGDGWPTFQDNCPTTYNPDQRDSDGDGKGDACDNCICKWNPLQENSDGDALGDSCDPARFNGLVPPVPPVDQDGDGTDDDHDNCPCVYNASQADSDGDGYGDTCDVCEFHLVELPIYGLGRIGVAMPDIDITNDAPPDTVYTRYLNQKYYELTDHLGNVRAVLGDRKRTSTPGAGNYYADIRSYSHPYPFGMQQPGRHWSASIDTIYRYGFNGMETDPEVKEGAGQHYTTYFRQYDPRLGRWWSNDPVVQPGESPYAAMLNNPILLSDPLGNNPPKDGDPTWKPPPSRFGCAECDENVPNPFPGYYYATENGGWSYIWSGFYWVYYEPPAETIVVSTKRLAVIKPLDAPARGGPVPFAGTESELAKTTDSRGRPVIPPPDLNEDNVRAMGLNPALIRFDYYDQSTANILFGSHYNVYHGDYYIGRIEVRGKHSVLEYDEDGKQPGQEDIAYVAAHSSGSGSDSPLTGTFPFGNNELLNEFTYQAFNAPVSSVSVSQVDGDQGLAEQFDPLDMGGGSGFPSPSKLRNGHLAGGVHSKSKVPFDADGFPDFSGHIYPGGDVMITPTGSRNRDKAAAMKAADLKVTPEGWVWHHHQTRGRMQLVKQDIHEQTGHTGGFKLW